MNHYVYILNSIKYPEKFYVGYTQDIQSRLATHNAGESIHTAKNKPWVMITYMVFVDKNIAFDFEKYLKSHSGRAFASKHFSSNI
jgi:predicted GIY-YIG superfamily endonuclease